MKDTSRWSLKGGKKKADCRGTLGFEIGYLHSSRPSVYLRKGPAEASNPEPLTGMDPPLHTQNSQEKPIPPS